MATSRFKIEYSFENLRAELKGMPVEKKIDKLIWVVVLASANVRAYQSTHGLPDTDIFDEEYESNHPYWSIQRFGLYSSRLLGKLLRDTGQSCRPSMSSLFEKVYLDQLERQWNKRRRLNLLKPTFDQILNAVNDRSTLVTCKGVFIYSRCHEGTGDYGEAAWHAQYKYFSTIGEQNSVFHAGDQDIAKEIYTIVHERYATKEDYGPYTLSYLRFDCMYDYY